MYIYTVNMVVKYEPIIVIVIVIVIVIEIIITLRTLNYSEAKKQMIRS